MTTSYRIETISPNEVSDLIQEKLDQTATEDLRRWNNKEYRLKRIRLPAHALYYNLENVRTEEECEQYIEENNLSKDHFEIKNFSNISTQQQYHRIIYAEALEKKAEYVNKFITLKEMQTEAIYVNLDGIAMNGNTRLSFWRENGIFPEIECLVYIERHLFADLLEVTNYQDSLDDIDQEYAWYNKVKQVLKNQPDEGYSSDDFKRKAQGAAMSEKQLQEQITQYYLAKEFFSAGYDNYKRFKDLRSIGKGYGAQALKGLREGVEKANKTRGITGEIINKLKEESWWVINDQASSTEYRDAYRAIQAIWKDSNIRRLITETSNTGDFGILEDSPEEEVIPRVERTDEDFREKFKEYSVRDEIDRAESASLAFAELLKDYAQKIQKAVDSHINASTDTESAKEAQDILEQAVSNSREKVDQL